MSNATKKETGRNNFIAEWYGTPVYPAVMCPPGTVERLERRLCPFLSEALKQDTICIKNEASTGVCSIATPGNNVFMVCPYRALDTGLLKEAAKDIFGEAVGQLVSAPKIAQYLQNPTSPHFVFYFQDKLGGEISLAKTSGSPEISLDLTFVRAAIDKGKLILRDFGCMEAQTMDFHGSYGHAVEQLLSVLKTHKAVFPEEMSRDMAKDWLSRKIEGPNLANVFKRTFYQALLKFMLAGRDSCKGVVLALPLAVWKSWKPHLGGVEATALATQDGPNTWILIFDLKEGKIQIVERIKASAKLLAKAAFETASDNMVAGPLTTVRAAIADRVKTLIRGAVPKGTVIPVIEWLEPGPSTPQQKIT